MLDNLDNFGLTTSTNFTVQTLKEVDSTSEELPSPTFVTNTMRPEVVACERRERLRRVTDEATNGVCVHAQEEWNEQMVSVPKGLE